MQAKMLQELLLDLEKELYRLGYTEATLKYYRNRWQKLLQFAGERNELYFSEQLGIDFIESRFHIMEYDFSKVLSQKDTQELRVIRMIGDFQLHNSILRRYYKHKEIITDPYFMEVSSKFKGYCSSRDYSKVTTGHYVKQTEHFMDYLISQGIADCHDININLVNGYIRTLAGYTYKTVEQNICSIRSFLRYLYEEGILSDNLASKTPMVQARKQTRIPSVWTKEELQKLIGAIDRGNPKGKRDYAIILLACVLGLRVTDIKNLTFDSLHWEEKKLIFVQSKTRETIILPLPPEIGWAVIDYLKYGRPKVASNVVFVRHLAPFLPFSESDHLTQIIRGYMRIAHLPTLKKFLHRRRMTMRKSDYPYVGPFSEHIRSHVLLKQAVGYKYEAEARHLYRFSVFTAEKYPDAVELTKEIILDWCLKKEYEAQGNQCTRASILRQLALYMDSMGMNCYIIPKNYYPTEEQYVPHIYTEEELRAFFRETDKCHYVSECPYRHLIMPVFYRMIYSCGLRSSEARLLKAEDVDLESGILTIQHSKKDNSRLVPMSDELADRCCRYYEKVNPQITGNEYFFPGIDGKPMTVTNVYHNFRRFLWKVGISHGGRGKGPRVQDFRHAYACHCLKNWVMQGKDLNAYLPMLKTYMGHFTFKETAYYLRMTADIYPDITIRMEGKYPDIIPGLEGNPHETN